MGAIVERRKHKGLTARYAQAARNWHSGIVRLGYPEAYLRLLAARKARAKDHVLDVGTGSGLFSEIWHRSNGPPASLTLLDPCRPMLSDACARMAELGASFDAIESGIGTEAIPSESADVVLCAHVLEHLDDPLEGLSWVRSRLVPGGTAFLAVSRPHWCTALLRWRWGHRAYGPEVMFELLNRAGFSEIELVPFVAGPPSRTSMGYVANRPGPDLMPTA